MIDSKSAISRVVELGEREATVLENSCIRVMIDDQGGMTPELSGRRASGEWLNAHWLPWFRSNSGEKYNDNEHGSFWKAKLLYQIAGNFPCLPSFGPGHIIDGVHMPPHGWTANETWRYVTSDTDESGIVWTLSVMDSPAGEIPLSFSKIDALLPNQGVHYTSLRVRTRGNEDIEICAGNHNIVGAPFLSQGCRVSGAAKRWITPPPGGEFDTTTRLALGAEFASLDKAPLRNGGKTDLSVTSPPIGYTDFVAGALDRSARLCWLSTVNPALKMAYISFSPGPAAAADDDIVLYFNEIWMQYGGRPFTPWAPYEGGPDQSYCLGVESAVSAYAYGLEYSRELHELLGNPTTVTIPAAGYKTLRSGVLFAPYDGGVLDEGTADVQGENEKLVCAGKGKVIFDADPRFEALRGLEGRHV
ncbi:MAG: hypothetical protein LBB82_06265 [Treponema sp.]|jgi:hypothetical protein|nr:hypothetical protein [Treponema sp.]